MKLLNKNQLKNTQVNKYLVLIPSIKEEKTQKFTTTVFTILALIFFAIFAINPTLSTIASLQKQLDDDKFVERKLTEKINNLSILEQQYSTLENDLPFVYAAIPVDSNIPTLTGELQTLAKNSNVNLISFQTSAVDVSDDLVGNKPFSSFSFSITLSGNYENIKQFIIRMSNIQRIITLGEVSISQSDTDKISGLNSVIKGIAYFKK